MRVSPAAKGGNPRRPCVTVQFTAAAQWLIYHIYNYKFSLPESSRRLFLVKGNGGLAMPGGNISGASEDAVALNNCIGISAMLWGGE